MLKSGLNILIIGLGGIGKLYVIDKFYNYVRENSMGLIYKILSMGVLVIIINGIILYLWVGILLGYGMVEELVNGMRLRNKEKWRWIRILIIDEILMIYLDLFDKLDIIGKILRKNNKLFGGI